MHVCVYREPLCYSVYIYACIVHIQHTVSVRVPNQVRETLRYSVYMHKSYMYALTHNVSVRASNQVRATLCYLVYICA